MSYRTVLLKSVNDNFIELEADGVITPGDLCERVAGEKVQRHSTAGGNAQKLIAIENYHEGKDPSDDYADGERVILKPAVPGEQFAMLLTDESSGAGGHVVEGEFLQSDGAGRLTIYSAENPATESSGEGSVSPLRIVAIALEENEMADSSATDTPRFAVEIV